MLKQGDKVWVEFDDCKLVKVGGEDIVKCVFQNYYKDRRYTMYMKRSQVDLRHFRVKAVYGRKVSGSSSEISFDTIEGALKVRVPESRMSFCFESDESADWKLIKEVGDLFGVEDSENRAVYRKRIRNSMRFYERDLQETKDERAAFRKLPPKREER